MCAADYQDWIGVGLRFGRSVAETAATILEYQDTGWVTNTNTF